MLWFAYVIILILFLSTSFFKLKQRRLAFSIFSIVFLTFLAGGRADYGVDYEEYREIFESVPFLSEFFSSDVLADIHGEYFFLLLCSILKSVGLGFEEFSVVFAFLSVFVTIYAFNKFGWGVSAAVLLYFSHNFFLKEMGQIRNGLSSAILLMAFYYLKNFERKKFFISVVLASLMHSAALVFLFAYFAIKRSFCFLFALLAFAFVLGAVGWLDVALGLVGQYLPSRLSDYIGTEYYSNIGLSNPQTIKQMVFCILFFLIFVEFSKNKKFSADVALVSFGYAVKIYMVSVFSLLIFVEFDLLARRIASYFAIVELIILTQCLYLFATIGDWRRYFLLVAFIVLYASSSAFFNLSFREGFDGAYGNWMVSPLSEGSQ